jgi:succinate-acetate transporter protein
MASSMGGSEAASGAPGAKMASGWTGTTILGTLAFGLTAILFGLSQMPKPYSNGFVAATGANVETDLFFGGLVLILVGIISLLKDHSYWGAAFLGYGAFWASWSSTGQSLHGFVLAPGVGAFSIAGLAFIWLLFTLTFLVGSMKHGWGAFFGLLFLFVAFILIIVEAWTLGGATKVSSGEQWAVAGLWIFTGLIWWLKGTAEMTNQTYGRRVLPL